MMAEHPFTIHHSGLAFTSMGFNGREFVWPIEEYLARTNHGPSVRERIRRLNPNGKPESDMPRGVHMTYPRFRYDAVGPREFIRRYGRAAYRDAIQRGAVRHDGHRKLIPATYVREFILNG